MEKRRITALVCHLHPGPLSWLRERGRVRGKKIP